METKIKDITGAEITVTDLKEAVRQCRECLASPYLMPSGHTVGENHAYMLRQLLALQGGNGNKAGNGRENTTRKKSDDNNRPIFLFPVNRPPYGRPASRAVHARYVRQCHGEKFQRLNPTRHACICTS